MDYARPIRALNNTDERKYWILLITCLTTRYTCVELAVSLDTDTLLTLLRRFCSQYGVPKEIRTDNGAQFTMLSAVTKEAQKQLHLLSISQDLPVSASFLHCHHKAEGSTRTLMQEEDLRTLLKEAESIINDRPLTSVSNEDIGPLRPVDFVFPSRRSQGLLTVDEALDPSPFNNSHGILIDNWMKTSSLTDYSNHRWREEYVQLLQERNQVHHKPDRLASRAPLKVGEIVFRCGSRSAKQFCPATKETIERPYKKIYQLKLSVPDKQDTPTTEHHESGTSSQPDKPQSTSQRKVSTNASRRRGSTTTTMTILTLAMCFHATEASTNSSWMNTDVANITNTISWIIQLIAATSGILLISTIIHVITSIVKCSRRLMWLANAVFNFIISTFHAIAKLTITVKANRSKSCLEIQHKNNEPLITLRITAVALRSYYLNAHRRPQKSRERENVLMKAILLHPTALLQMSSKTSPIRKELAKKLDGCLTLKA
ncbi:unnamed protein product [Caenorhabditis sp. 36 PRJEB53466]|nr:unnamed protein product [Caenorhabditis sp. 36 PRJEB53466]